MSLVKSKQRVNDHGEVFTPSFLVESMIDLVHLEAGRIESRFLEPACGSGNFLVPVLLRKLQTVEAKYGKSEFEKCHHALLALMSIYGIEILPDNVEECRSNLLDTFMNYLGGVEARKWKSAGKAVLDINIVHGDALTMCSLAGSKDPIVFAEWSYVGKGQYQRRDFRFDTMTLVSSLREDDTLFADLGRHEVFTPVKDYGLLSAHEIGGDANE